MRNGLTMMRHRRHLLIFLAVFGLFSNIIFGQQASAAGKKQYELEKKGRAAYRNKDYKKAEYYYKQVDAIVGDGQYGSSENALDKLGRIYEKQGKLKLAEKYYLKGLIADAKHFGNRVYFTYSEDILKFYKKTNQLNKSKIILKKAISSLEPKHDKFFQTKKLSTQRCQELCEYISPVMAKLMKEGNLKEATFFALNSMRMIKKAERPKNLNHSLSDIQFYLGKIYLKQSRFTEARKILSESLRIRRQSYSDQDWIVAEVLDSYCKALSKSGNKKKSLLLSKKLYSYWSPRCFINSESWSQLLKKYLYWGRNRRYPYKDEANKLATKMLTIADKWGSGDARYAETYAQIANYHFLHGDYKKAPNYFSKALKSANLIYKNDNKHLALTLIRWGKPLEYNRVLYAQPSAIYTIALTRLSNSVKGNDPEIYKAVKHVAGYCHNNQSKRGYGLYSNYKLAFQVIEKMKGLKSEETLDMLSNLIYWTQKHINFRNSQANWPEVKNMYEKLLSAEVSLYGKESPEVKETATKYVSLLKQLNIPTKPARIKYGI